MIITKDVLCLLAHLKPCLQEKKYFMDDSLLVEAIKKNEPDTVSKMTNSFYKDALGQISTNPSIGKYLQSDAMRHLCNSFSQFVSVVNKDSQDYLYNDHGILNNERGLGSHEKIVIMIQLTMWSRLSIRCFKCICIAVQFFRRNINIGESELWSWLHSFTTCVSCSTSWVYDMYATALEKKNPSCQVLLLSTSIHHFLGEARKYLLPLQSTQFSLKIVHLKIATSHFCRLVQSKRKETLLSRNSLTLDSFLGNDYNDVWNDLTKKFSSFVDDAASTLASSNKYVETQLSLRNVKTTPVEDAVSALVILGRSQPIPSKQDTSTMRPLFLVVAAAPLIMEEKYQQLRCQLIKIKKQFNICGMIKALEHESTSLEDKRQSYIQSCIEFCKRTFQENKTPQYLVKLVAYSGLLIHDILKVEHNKNLLDYQNVFAHILSFCLDGSYDEKKKIVWKIFFGKLLPRSAFAPSIDIPTRKLSLYFKKCFELMEIKPPDENQLDYYYQHNYFSLTKKVGESKVKVNTVFDAIGDGGNGRQSLGTKKKYTKAEASHERQVDNNQSLCNKKHEAKVALGGNFKSPKSNKATEACVIPGTKKHGGKRAAQYLSPSGKGSVTKHAKVALGGNFKSPKSNKATEATVILGIKKHGVKHGVKIAGQYLSPSGKGSGTKRASLRTSPKTNFFSPDN